MDVGAADLSNAAGSGSIINPPGGVSSAIAGITNTPNIFANAGWWTPSSTIVTAPGNTDVMNQLCRVCGEPAAGFHFGAFTCEGCKSFFGRTYNNLGSISECKNGGVCVINKKNRTACKACRLRKCLMVGMSKSGSRYGRRSNWFKIHCLLQEQSHQAQQARLKDPTKLPFDKVLNSLDAANNNSSANFPAASATNSPMNQGRLLKPDEVDPQSPRLLLRPDLLSHDLLRPEPNRFPIWRGPPFFHPAALNHMQLLNTPFFPFQQRFIVPYVNQVSPQMPVTSLSSSSSESVSPRSTPSPKTHRDDDDEGGDGVVDGAKEVAELKQSDSFEVADKSIAFLRSLGPEQDEPIDLSKKPSEINVLNDDDGGDNKFGVDGGGDDDLVEEKIHRFLKSDVLDLTWKT